MPARTLSIEDAKAANLTVIEDGEKGGQAVHDLVVAYQANRRTGSANCKTRAEVRGTGKKMYRQKGTGNARHRTSKAPIFTGGGVAHGPHPRDYTKHVPKRTRKLALQRVLGERIQDGSVQVVDAFEIADGKTKSFVNEINGLTGQVKVLVVAKAFSDQTYYSARNVQWAQLETADTVNVEQLLDCDSIILTEDVLEVFAKRTS